MKLSIGRRDVFVSKFKAGVVIGILWLATLCGAGFLLYLGADSYGKARARLTEQATSYAHLIAEHDRFGFTVADVILRDMLDWLTYEDFNGTMSPERRTQVLGYLTRHRERLPGIASFTVVGADGIRRIGVAGKDFTNLADRGYFQASRDGRESFISNVEEGRASGKPGIHVARRYAAPDGTFGGVILLNLGAEEVFVPFYRSLSLGKDFNTTLRDPNRILISYPGYTLSAKPMKTRDALGDRMAAGEDRGVMVTTDPSDGLEKITAFERLEGTNIFATASLSTGSALSEARVLGVGALVSALALILGAVGATSAIAKARALAKARDEAIKAGAERKLLIRKLNSVVEDERKSIAIEIHDVLNAILVGVRMDSQAILALTSMKDKTPEAISEIADRAQSITRHASNLYANCRALVTRLRPEILDVLGLDRAIEEIVVNLNAASSSCRFTFESEGNVADVEGGVAIAVYRLAQEALSNVAKHAHASHATVQLKATRDNWLEIVVTDDGEGFDSTAVTPGIGVIGMRERVEGLNGQLSIESGAKHGTVITARFPLLTTAGSADPQTAPA